MKDFKDSLEKLSLESCILIIGFLSQRALELMMKDKSEKESKSKSKSKLTIPSTSLIV